MTVAGGTELWRMSATELAEAIRSRQASSQEVIEAHLRRIDAVNASVNAVVIVLAVLALEAARAVIAWAPTTGATSLMAGHHPDNHASGKLLSKLGFVYYGDEYYPPTGLIEPCYRLTIAGHGSRP